MSQEAAHGSKRHGVHTMDLSSKGIDVLQKVVDKRFNAKSIGRIAKSAAAAISLRVTVGLYQHFWRESASRSTKQRFGSA